MNRTAWWGRASWRFVLLCVVLSILAHAATYLVHEYAHSLLAWMLGWMAQPFGIDYGAPTLANVIFLGDVSDNVDYAPIFASGHGMQAACIALGGAFVGNGLGYVVAAWVLRHAVARQQRLLALASFWFALMCAANVWSYVPVRTLATHADMALAARGLGLPGWGLLLCLLPVVAWIEWHFFVRAFHSACAVAAGPSATSRVVLMAFGAFWFFSFFVGDALDGSYGLFAQVLAMLSRYGLFPLCVALLYRREVDAGTGLLAIARVVLITVVACWFFAFLVSGLLAGLHGALGQMLAMLSRYVLFPLCVALLYRGKEAMPR